MITWCEMGGEPVGFFSTTPRMMGLVVEGRARARQHAFRQTAWLAHTLASLERANKIPSLDKLVGGRDVARRNDRPRPADQLLSLARRWHFAMPSEGAGHAR
ncbi:MAG: hypothetical protein Q8S53_15450 [Brevundimonas sp.]|uniref:hypothetical protein n=1 Tax=Brevundimonas sp. TaxID=1871086 RepID=UPI002733DE94|nr:hypothetical protein [Brevundimonas sp.]MDP3379760.1 hypothetical protein [Brevundimonas sp.]